MSRDGLSSRTGNSLASVVLDARPRRRPGTKRQAVGVELRLVVVSWPARNTGLAEAVQLLAHRRRPGQLDRMPFRSSRLRLSPAPRKKASAAAVPFTNRLSKAGVRIAVGDVDVDAGASAKVQRDGVVARRAVDASDAWSRRGIAAPSNSVMAVVAGTAADRQFASKRLDLDGVAAVARATRPRLPCWRPWCFVTVSASAPLAQREVEEIRSRRKPISPAI